MSTIIIFAICLIAAVILLIVGAKKSDAQPVKHEQVAKAIEDFLEGRGDDHDWDDFLHWRISDPYLESVRDRCEKVHDDYPATQKGHYCSEDGMNVVRGLLLEVRAKATRIGEQSGD